MILASWPQGEGTARGHDAEAEIPEAHHLVREGRARPDLLRVPHRAQEARPREQQGRVLRQAAQEDAEEADPVRDRGGLEKRIVSMFLHYNEAIGRRRVRCWREIADYYEARQSEPR